MALFVFDRFRLSQYWNESHNLKVVGSNPTPATKLTPPETLMFSGVYFFCQQCVYVMLGIYWESRGIQSQRMSVVLQGKDSVEPVWRYGGMARTK